MWVVIIKVSVQLDALQYIPLRRPTNKTTSI